MGVKCVLSLRKAHRPRVFENRMLRKVLEPKRDEVTGEWRRLHDEELRDVYFIFLMAQQTPVGGGAVPPYYREFIIILRGTTLGRAPLDE